eukprot:jgi/Mesvir1/12168/Mv00412-RA.1
MDSVHSGMTRDMHFHVGGVCGDCAVQFLRTQKQPGDVDCPVCVNERRPPEHVAKLHPPFFELDATQTALAFVISGRGRKGPGPATDRGDTDRRTKKGGGGRGAPPAGEGGDWGP